VTPVPRPVTVVQAIKVRPDHHARLPDHLVTEEPMEIRVAGPGPGGATAASGSPVAVTMRTPGHDFELAAGFLVTEGLVRPEEIAAIGYCDAVADEDRYNTVTVTLDRPWSRPGPERVFAATSSCGICGKAAIDQVEVACATVAPAPRVPVSLIAALPGRLRRAQQVFDRTGGLHAAGLFEPDGRARSVREDVGRHNAVDKVVGHEVLGGGLEPSLAGCALMVSGRISFEIVQKAALAGIGTIAAVSAPSSLAVEAGQRLGVAVVGFVRDGSMSVYSRPERLDLGA
jgi:FdhD protein